MPHSARWGAAAALVAALAALVALDATTNPCRSDERPMAVERAALCAHDAVRVAGYLASEPRIQWTLLVGHRAALRIAYPNIMSGGRGSLEDDGLICPKCAPGVSCSEYLVVYRIRGEGRCQGFIVSALDGRISGADPDPKCSYAESDPRCRPL